MSKKVLRNALFKEDVFYRFINRLNKNNPFFV
jgi:hypothetical protein